MVPRYGFGAYGWNEQWSGNAAATSPTRSCSSTGHVARAGRLRLHDARGLVGAPRHLEASSRSLGRRHPAGSDAARAVAGAATKHSASSPPPRPFYPPFLAARLFNTLDHLTHGRVGMNLVTACPHAAAQNYGYEKHFEHDLRYEMADEWVQAQALGLVGPRRARARRGDRRLRRSHEGAPRRLRGRFYKTRGPLNTVPCRSTAPSSARPADRRKAATSARRMPTRSSRRPPVSRR